MCTSLLLGFLIDQGLQNISHEITKSLNLIDDVLKLNKKLNNMLMHIIWEDSSIFTRTWKKKILLLSTNKTILSICFLFMSRAPIYILDTGSTKSQLGLVWFSDICWAQTKPNSPLTSTACTKIIDHEWIEIMKSH